LAPIDTEARIFGPEPLSPLTDEQRDRARNLAWAVVRKFVLATTGAVGVKLGERLVDWVFGGSDDEDEDDDRDDDRDGDW
jgi:hypothetical protein